ncbi:MAG: ribosome biogenesis GTPase Der [Gammaproteobacteria bacterium]|nr:ribosome biogenesis GTPase Der [Gammaproteobacteria bacterium]
MTVSKSGVAAIVGRPNVGKSTLFNRLCRSRDALVHDRAGLTRDRKYGTARSIDDATVTLIDTGGLHDEGSVSRHVDEQVQLAISESDLVIFLVNARDGLTSDDIQISKELRRAGSEVLLVVNKIDGVTHGSDYALIEFSPLGFEKCLPISASNGHGVQLLTEVLTTHLPLNESEDLNVNSALPVAVLGRPNVGKSTLVNALLNDQRCIVSDQPGTTRDAIQVVLDRGDVSFAFTDTAGIRRKGSVDDVIEKFSIVKALNALRASEMTLLVIDANEGIVEQDLHLIQFAIEAGTGIVLVVNKWDKLDSEQRAKCQRQINRRLKFADWIQIRYVSALLQSGIDSLLDDIVRIHSNGAVTVSSSELTETLADLLLAHSPPLVRGRSIKLRYAHPIDSHPPSIMVHGNQTDLLPASYKRYLENGFRQLLDLDGWPVVIKYRTSKNPFRDRQNRLTPRQQRKRDRIIRRRSKSL